MVSGPSPRPRGPARDIPGVAAFTITLTHPGLGITVLDPGGDLDAATGPTLERCLDRALHARRAQQVVLDLSHLGFCGAAGLSCLLTADDLVHDLHTGLHVVPGAAMRRLLAVAGLGDRFALHRDRATALAAALAAVSTTVPAIPALPPPALSPPDLVAVGPQPGVVVS